MKVSDQQREDDPAGDLGAVQHLQRAFLADTGSNQPALHHGDVFRRLRNKVAQPLDDFVERQAGMLDLRFGRAHDADHALHGLFRPDVHLHAGGGGQRHHGDEDQNCDKEHGLRPRYSRFFS